MPERIKKNLCFIVVGVIFFVNLPAYAAESFSVASGIYGDKSFSQKKMVFLPMERVYLVLDFTNIAPGKYDLAADWITPWGNLERQTLHTFTVDSLTQSYQVYFWLHLRKKGPLARTITGSAYKEEHYGEWKVRVFLNGSDIAEQHFQIR